MWQITSKHAYKYNMLENFAYIKEFEVECSQLTTDTGNNLNKHDKMAQIPNN